MVSGSDASVTLSLPPLVTLSFLSDITWTWTFAQHHSRSSISTRSQSKLLKVLTDLLKVTNDPGHLVDRKRDIKRDVD